MEAPRPRPIWLRPWSNKPEKRAFRQIATFVNIVCAKLYAFASLEKVRSLVGKSRLRRQQHWHLKSRVVLNAHFPQALVYRLQMGCAASTCSVSNKALYTIAIEVYSSEDPNVMTPRQQINLLPGQCTSIPLKKAAYLRVSGNGRTQQLFRVVPMENVVITRVGKNENPEGATADARARMGLQEQLQQIGQNSREPEETQQTGQNSRKTGQASPFALQNDTPNYQSSQSWLDKAQGSSKDELQLLVRRLEKEALQQRIKERNNGLQQRDSEAIRAVRAS